MAVAVKVGGQIGVFGGADGDAGGDEGGRRAQRRGRAAGERLLQDADESGDPEPAPSLSLDQ